VLVRDPKGRCEPIALLSMDLALEARQSLLYYLRRWSLEATFQAARLHLGIDGQRQRHDLAVAFAIEPWGVAAMTSRSSN
jgi:hypothetical protein